MTVSKNSRIVQVFSQAFLNPKQDMTETLKADYQKSLDLIKELAQDIRNPQNQYELNQIMTYVIDSLIRFRTNYLDVIGDVQRTGYRERPQFKYRTQEVEAYWQAVTSTADASRIGFAYEPLKAEALSAIPVAEWIEIADGRYDFGTMIEDVMNQFDINIAQKVQGTLYSAMHGLGATPNYAAGNGINQSVFDELLAYMMRFGGGVAIVGDYEALQKLPNITAISGSTSDAIIDEYNRNGVIGMYKGARVVQLVNPYVGLNGFDTALNRGYVYIVPNVRPDMKTLKLWFRGGLETMADQSFEDKSYRMRFDQLFGAGVVGVEQIRQPIAIYEDTELSS